nr:immunoglobulin light chain junction region [Macaca mulatta]MPO04428.1 immunoglobulin light chain junction region [Macaca mulatta]MPO04904.1 immunoglobulin light chain junction region [Macaca mulatta]MPO10111.1 immunoglobulin light chain junction region [Macaca mulatta]MPO11136.1 immunoglobulin light chain junction region [Macaca mulatta]
CSSCAGSNVLF